MRRIVLGAVVFVLVVTGIALARPESRRCSGWCAPTFAENHASRVAPSGAVEGLPACWRFARAACPRGPITGFRLDRGAPADTTRIPLRIHRAARNWERRARFTGGQRDRSRERHPVRSHGLVRRQRGLHSLPGSSYHHPGRSRFIRTNQGSRNDRQPMGLAVDCSLMSASLAGGRPALGRSRPRAGEPCTGLRGPVHVEDDPAFHKAILRPARVTPDRSAASPRAGGPPRCRRSRSRSAERPMTDRFLAAAVPLDGRRNSALTIGNGTHHRKRDSSGLIAPLPL